MSRPAQGSPKVLLYSHDSYGLGHFRRSSSVAWAIADLDPRASLLCVTGSPRPDLFPLPPQADYVKLPSVTKDDSGAYVSRTLKRDLAGVVHLREQTLRAVARSFAPDVILVDHAPLGVAGELLPMLREQGSREGVVIALGMRDILDEPARARNELRDPRLIEAMTDFYDQLIVYGHREVCDLAKEYELPETIARRMTYVGVACCHDGPVPRTTLSTQGRDDSAPRLLVTAGGGADGMTLLSPAVRSLARGWTTGEVRATVVTGPFLSSWDYEELMLQARDCPHLKLLKVTSRLPHLLAEADLAITMGGYNSIYEALCLGVRVLALPRTKPRREQYDRVRRLVDLDLVQALTLDTVTDPDRFRKHVHAALSRPALNARSRGLRFEGAREAARRLLGAVGSTTVVGPSDASGGGRP